MLMGNMISDISLKGMVEWSRVTPAPTSSGIRLPNMTRTHLPQRKPRHRSESCPKTLQKKSNLVAWNGCWVWANTRHTLLYTMWWAAGRPLQQVEPIGSTGVQLPVYNYESRQAFQAALFDPNESRSIVRQRQSNLNRLKPGQILMRYHFESAATLQNKYHSTFCYSNPPQDRVKLYIFFLSNTYFTSVYPTAMWLHCNRPITGAEGSYKASDG